MSFEVVYTSVRRGLRTGSRGFCTVAATEGIPRALHDKLESLSGYRHTEAAAGHRPPVNYSHLVIRIQRQVFHVLSRIGDAGIDYSGRTNKIAHHLALTTAEAERFPDGPASLLCDDSFWYDRWDSEPTELPGGRYPECVAVDDAGFGTWESVFGDAGWAGMAGQAVADGWKPVSIIVPNGHHTRALLTEALQLIPEEQRWRLCFSTYFSRLASGTQCHWRFVLDGTGAARRLRSRSSVSVLDYTAGSDRLPAESVFVQAARDGHVEEARAALTSVTSRSVASSAAAASTLRRPSTRRRSRPPAAVPRRAAANPFDVSDDSDSDQQDPPPPAPSGSRAGLYTVLLLFLAILGILVFVGIRHLL